MLILSIISSLIGFPFAWKFLPNGGYQFDD